MPNYGELSLDNLSYLKGLVHHSYKHCMAGCNGYILGSGME